MAKSNSANHHPVGQNQRKQKPGLQTAAGQSIKRGSWLNFTTGLVLIVFGLLLLVTPVYLKHLIESQSLSRDFATEPVKIDLSNFNSLSSNDIPNRISIPDLSIDLPVKLSPIRNGFWVVWEDEAGFGEGSAPPGTVGNTVIFAHARKGLFLPLKQAQKGMQITVSTPTISYTYSIVDIKTVLPYDIEVIAPTDDQTLTLYTCSGFLDKHRLIVTAKPY